MSRHLHLLNLLQWFFVSQLLETIVIDLNEKASFVMFRRVLRKEVNYRYGNK